MSKYYLSDIADFISDKIEFSSIELDKYISTDNMLPNFNGVTLSTVEPSLNKCTKFKAGDTLFSNIRTYFKKVWFADFDGGCSPDVIVMRTKNEEFVLHEFLYLLICSEDFINFTVMSSNGAKMPRGDKKAMLKYEFEIPSIEEQKIAINHYFKIKEKIQLNTQINQTLEQIAQALFKSWFVDFDPVHAKVQALSDGMSLEQAELAAMQAISGKTAEELTALSQTQPDRYAELAETAKAFPCEMVEVDGVEVPKGWEVKPLPEIIDFLEGPGIRNWQYTDEEDGIKFINIRCIQNGDLTLTTANKITKEEAFGKYKHFQLEEDDIVVSTSGTLGRFAFVRKEHLPLSLNTSVIRFRPIKNKSTLGFIAGFVENQLQHELEIRASGSAQRNFGPTHLKQISLLVPDFKLLELHQKYASSLFEKRKQLLSEIDVLKDARDLLLPKLLNGEFIR
ncbi:restriction endonuclease subunit S [Haemophilus parahaemolyticus]|uniref:restriction endonuclease subunit S n=1 Tax=Haemophilus parahaemolyticus TaxID=735 RepID=UPI00290EEC66|nr:restriction endonuclease subunit S [Haemophilus parahaemolyticus]MDU4465335.1 restriction endonuclease subunit S [Haemophilus parahaemolyticus]